MCKHLLCSPVADEGAAKFSKNPSRQNRERGDGMKITGLRATHVRVPLEVP
jgi:hypothetical protein